MSNYTPGPWVIVRCKGTSQHWDIKQKGSVLYVASTQSGAYRDDAETDANARLIAAAPDLAIAAAALLLDLLPSDWRTSDDGLPRVYRNMLDALERAGVTP